MDPSTTTRPGTLALTSVGLVVVAALLITVVSFIALVLAAGVLVTGGEALARGDGRAAPVVGILLALGAVAVFVVEVSD